MTSTWFVHFEFSVQLSTRQFCVFVHTVEMCVHQQCKIFAAAENKAVKTIKGCYGFLPKELRRTTTECKTIAQPKYTSQTISFLIVYISILFFSFHIWLSAIDFLLINSQSYDIAKDVQSNNQRRIQPKTGKIEYFSLATRRQRMTQKFILREKKSLCAKDANDFWMAQNCVFYPCVCVHWILNFHFSESFRNEKHKSATSPTNHIPSTHGLT